MIKLNLQNETVNFISSFGNVGFWSWDIDRDIFQWNDNMYKIMCRNINDKINKYDDFKSYLTEEENASFRFMVNGLKEKKDSKEHIFKTEINNHIKYISSRCVLEGGVVLGCSFDITETMELKEELKKEREMLSSFFDLSPVGLAIVNPDGSFEKVNDSFCSIAGRSRESLLNCTFKEITHKDDLQKDIGFVNAMLNGEINSYKMKKRYIKQNGVITWVELTVTSKMRIYGKIEKFFVQIVDINDKVSKTLSLAQSIENVKKEFN
jgi:PAS domain S-box-containing protein